MDLEGRGRMLKGERSKVSIYANPLTLTLTLTLQTLQRKAYSTYQ